MIVYLTPRKRHGAIEVIEGKPDGGFKGFKSKDGRLIGRDRWYRTREAAEDHMRQLRANRIRSLRKELERLEALGDEVA